VIDSIIVEAAVLSMKPLAIWIYAKRVLVGPGAVVDRRDLAGPLAWIALWFVPYLIAAALMVSSLFTVVPAASVMVCSVMVALAVADLLVARAAVLGARSAVTSITTGLAGVIFGAAVVYMIVADPGARRLAEDIDMNTIRQGLRQLAVFVATLAALTWSQRIRANGRVSS
jgi:hypothetical protein